MLSSLRYFVIDTQNRLRQPVGRFEKKDEDLVYAST
jgi:hypothetical protein